MKNWTHLHQSKPNSRTTQGSKISLKNTQLSVRYSQNYSNTRSSFQTIQKSQKKKSIKNLLTYLGKNNQPNQNKFQTAYHSNPQLSSTNLNCCFFNNCFVREKGISGSFTNSSKYSRFMWMDHWLSLSNNSVIKSSRYPVPEKIRKQIEKDICRTQSDYKEFESVQYQQALYKCLIDYASIDPEVGYVQGMNIVCSILIYHAKNLDQCGQVFKYLMINRRLRQAYLGNFQFVSKITKIIQQCVKQNCQKLYRHIILQNKINIQVFCFGWILSMMGNIIPLQSMHFIINNYIEKGWISIIKIIVAIFLQLKYQMLLLQDQNDIMGLFSTTQLKNKKIIWKSIIDSSQKIQTLTDTNI